MEVITFNELRRLKDKLPNGTVKKLAKEFDMNEETIRNYFGGSNYEKGEIVGIHTESGPYGGLVTLDDMKIFKRAKQIVNNK